jgi:hypothetical protein
MAEFLQGDLAQRAADAKFQGMVEERHKEKLGLLVPYWWTRVTLQAEFDHTGTKLRVGVPRMVRGAETTTVHVAVTAPLKGRIAAEALTDGKAVVIVRGTTDFKTTIHLTAECVLTRVKENDGVKIRIELREWKPVLQETTFDSKIVNRLRGPIQAAVNQKLVEVAAPLRDKANAALRKAYEEGKLKLGR